MRLHLRPHCPRADCSPVVVQGKALSQRRRRERQKRNGKWGQDEDDSLWSLLAEPEIEEEADYEPCPICLELEHLLMVHCPANGMHRVCFACLRGMQNEIIADPWGAGVPAVGLTADGQRLPVFALRCPLCRGLFCNAYCSVRDAVVGFAAVLGGW